MQGRQRIFEPMSLFISSLNSGSNGNCYYIGNETDAILIDAGISCRETEKRMKRLGLSMALVKAIFISHEHADHISGITTLSKKHKLPVYITQNTLRNSGLNLPLELVYPFSPTQSINVGALAIKAFVKSHDAIDPHSFVVSFNDLHVGVFTDIGYPCQQVMNHFSQCHAVFLESNYCEDMLENGGYPYFLKKRISGDKGHLSNRQALDLFLRYKADHLSHLLLSHLSKNNNSPQLVNDLFTKVCGKTKIVVASRYEESPVFEIQGSPAPMALKPPLPTYAVQQLSLF
jgi:phosphoribosyl 1,2-cyclic phosphodiesterase